ncbi:nuclear factor related to kappa-B-binding protein [Athalia rosae]|uniref:nuclear factor related to kappa-B-binding protein n=1 Tax=Athalia rosae TaxID=37344 RepID=UPI0020349071|nr:nuclear factor related to kappa-B-binding protein [Athalia rosae]
MDMDECSGGDSVEEEEEEDEDSTRSNSSSSSSTSSTADTGDDSAEEQCTSASDSQTSTGDNENSEDTVRWETCVAMGTRVKLPQGLCEHLTIFQELFDYSRIWNENLSETDRECLSRFLPTFPEDCDQDAELEKTLHMLFNRENSRFGVAALDAFHNHLSAGHYRPDIRRMRSLVRKAQQRRLVYEERKRSYDLAGQLLKSRESLLSNAYKQGFSQPTHRISKFHWHKPRPAMVEERTRQRYLEELSALRAELGVNMRATIESSSEDEEHYSQQQLINNKKKKKRLAMAFQGTPPKVFQSNHDEDAVRPVSSTFHQSKIGFSIENHSLSLLGYEQSDDAYRSMLADHKKRRARRDNHPELNTQGISLAELSRRAQIGHKHKLPLNNAIRPVIVKKRIKLEQPSCPPSSMKSAHNNSVKPESDNSDHSHTIDNDHRQIMTMDAGTALNSVKAEPIDTYETQQLPTKKKIFVNSSPGLSNASGSIAMSISDVKTETEDLDYDSEIKTEVNIRTGDERETEDDEEDDKKQLNLDGIDMMQIPIQLDNGIDLLDDVKCGSDVTQEGEGREGDLMQETHSCFFSLLRDAFVSKGEYRMSTAEMRDAVMQWQGNPISPLNDWYSLAPSWPALVPLALGFLAGELVYSSQETDHQQEQELVPYLENKGRGVYAWIGAGRDSDSRLATYCARFLAHRDSLGPPVHSTSSTAIAAKQQVLQQQQQQPANSSNSSCRGGSPAIETSGIGDGSMGAMGEWEPPRALWPTEWKVRPSTAEEREEFRRQEQLRYATPHKAFTYRMHGYASVVGPVKGIYQHNVASGLNKPRGHSLLVADRPNFVTILALVRDATARLPNGEGTRADICQLLKDSQYIRDQGDHADGGHDKEGYLHSVVSGALDRLHYEADPCVRYYPRRKEWLYLHRARSESEFEMYHQQLQGVAKNKKNIGGTSRNKSANPISKPVNGSKEQPLNKETTPKREKKISTPQPGLTRKESRKAEEMIVDSNDQPVPAVVPAASTSLNSPATVATVSVNTTPDPPIEREKLVTVEVKPQLSVPPQMKKIVTSKPIAVTKTHMTNASQSLLQSNQHFSHHQIQVSTSAGLQTIRLSGHSVLHTQASTGLPVSTNANSSTNSNVTTILPGTKVSQQLQQQTTSSNQTGKSILQAVKQQQQLQLQQQQQSQQQQAMPQQQQQTVQAQSQQQPPQIQQLQQQQQPQQHVLPGKTLLASQIKLVSSGQIKSLLTGHGLQGQTIFIKQSASPATQQQLQQQQLKQQQQQQLQQRLVNSQQQQSSGMQRIIAQIGGKPIAVQIQQSPHQQQQQQQKILAKVLTSAGGGQLISVESLLAQKGLKLATATSHTGPITQVNKQGKQVIQTQYQVVSQAQGVAGQSKVIVSSQQQQQQPQTVRMVAAQLAGKPIMLASSSKGVTVAGGATGVVLSKQQQQQQPIILPSQLLNIKTLHGLKVIPAPAGLKTGAVYARVIAPSVQTSTANQQTQQQQQQQPAARNSYGTPRQE